MCQYCGGITFHDPMCPFYDGSKDDTGLFCYDCGASIKTYDRYVKINGNYYHMDCLTVDSLLEILGLEVETWED